MLISELGSLGELISSIAVVFSIAFLAFQVRQNTRALKVSAYADYVSRHMHIIEFDERNAELLSRGPTKADTSPAEHGVLVARLSAILRNGDALSYQREQGLLDETRWKSALAMIAGSVAESEVNRSIWETFQHRYALEYRTAINNRLAERENRVAERERARRHAV